MEYPKTPFVQSWTLFFLIDQIRNFNESVEGMCSVAPENRELYLYREFIIPILESNESYLKKIINNMKSQIAQPKSPEQYKKLLKEYTEVKSEAVDFDKLQLIELEDRQKDEMEKMKKRHVKNNLKDKKKSKKRDDDIWNPNMRNIW